jgi:hypothetical protein
MKLTRALELNSELYRIVFDDYLSFDFKLLKIKEFNFFNKLIKAGKIPPFFIYEEVFNICFLGEVELLNKNIPAGYIISTGGLIFELSGAKSGEEFLLEIAKERQEKSPDSLYEHMKSTIFYAFSSMVPKDIEEMTEKQFISNFVSAENKLSKSVPGYQRMDLKKIYEELYGKIEETAVVEEKKKEKPQQEVAFNPMYEEQQLGYWEVQEAQQRFIEEERARLSKEAMARKLDARKKG